MIDKYFNGIEEMPKDTEEAKADTENYFNSGHDNSADDEVEEEVDNNVDDDIPNFLKEAKDQDGHKGDVSAKQEKEAEHRGNASAK